MVIVHNKMNVIYLYIHYISQCSMFLHAFKCKEEKVTDSLRRADIATLHAFSFDSFTSNHIKWILLTFTYFSPPIAILVLINTVSTTLKWSHRFFKVTHVNPLGCRPLFTLNDWTASMQAIGISSCIKIKTEEQQGITLTRFYWKDKKNS